MKADQRKAMCVISVCIVCMVVSVSYRIGLAQNKALIEAVDKENRLCGARCLYVAFRSLGKGPDRYTKLLRQLGPVPRDGYSLLDLQKSAREFGCQAESMNMEVAHLALFAKKYEVILHLQPNHFVLVSGMNADEIALFDPEKKRLNLSLPELKSKWKGDCLVIGTEPIALPVVSNKKNYILWLLGTVATVGLAFAALRQWKVRS